MDHQKLTSFVSDVWETSILPKITDYIRIPCKSPAFDPDWEKNGYLEQAVKLIQSWCVEQGVPGLTSEIVRIPGRSPVLFMEVPASDGATDGDTVLLYGHFDKQPEMTGWREDLGPWIPKREGDKLYGRGGADDGYAAFAWCSRSRASASSGARTSARSS
jgi:acetylornithine deacetylase/succinyl-diaminopimelate desuccinylase-like protein